MNSLGVLAFALVLASASAVLENDDIRERHTRSIEGQACSNATGFACKLAYTVCNKETGLCECDSRVSVPMQIPLFPEVRTCIPFDYLRLTNGECLPTNPDICSLLVPGSFCDVSKRDGSMGKMKCTCKIGGTYPNCIVRVGSLCRENTTCTKDIPDSFCNMTNVSHGYGKCTCGAMDDKGFISNRDGTACRATNCAAKPCRGDPTSSTCKDSASGFECICNNNTKGRSHDFATEGICCNEHMVTCQDFSKCIKVTDLCNGISDCDDCSDEMQLYCTGPLPKKNPRCFRSFPDSDKDSTKTLKNSFPAVTQVGTIQPFPTNQQPAGYNNQAPTQQLTNPRLAYNNNVPNPYSGAANILRTNIPTVGIPTIGLPGF